MSLVWGQAAETWTFLIWSCVEKPSHHKHLMLKVLCWSSEVSWNSWKKNCRWRRWVRDEAGETPSWTQVSAVLQQEVSLLCVVVNETLYQPQEADTRNHFQPASKQLMMIGCWTFYFPKNVQPGPAEPVAEVLWWRWLFPVWSWAVMSSEPSLVNGCDGRTLLYMMVSQVHWWREDSRGVLKMPRRSHRPYKYFIRTLEKFFFFMWNRRTQRVLDWNLRIWECGKWATVIRRNTHVFQSALQRQMPAGLEGSWTPLPAPGGKQSLVQLKTCKNKCEESYMCMHRACDGWRAGPCSCHSWGTLWSSCVCITGVAAACVLFSTSGSCVMPPWVPLPLPCRMCCGGLCGLFLARLRCLYFWLPPILTKRTVGKI